MFQKKSWIDFLEIYCGPRRWFFLLMNSNSVSFYFPIAVCVLFFYSLSILQMKRKENMVLKLSECTYGGVIVVERVYSSYHQTTRTLFSSWFFFVSVLLFWLLSYTIAVVQTFFFFSFQNSTLSFPKTETFDSFCVWRNKTEQVYK